MNDFVLVITLGVMVPAILTVLALEGRKGRYRIEVGRPSPATLPTVRSACTCGDCPCCDPLGLAFHGFETPIGYGLTNLPVDAGELDEPDAGFPLPNWATSEVCGACLRRSEELGFLCQRCTLIAGRDRVHQVYQLLEDGDYTRAWPIAEAIIRDVKHFSSKAPCN
jgi:hypothetical protein